MKKFLLSAAAILILSPAVAADLSRPIMKAPLAPMSVYNWTGFYIGVNGGGAWGESRYDFTGAGTTTGNFNISGGFVGGTFGYNWQVTNWVLGIEGDIDAADIKGSALCPNPSFTCAVKDEWLATVRGRLGFLVNPNWLIYGTAGGAFGDVKATVSPAFGSQTIDSSGWAAGAGFEFMFAQRWSLKAEYLHVDLGNATCDIPNCSAATSVRIPFHVDTVRGGLNFHF